MEKLVIEKTDTTPEIIFDPLQGVLKITGRSIPLNPKRFYEPVLDWINSYTQQAKQETVLDVYMDYFNTASTFLITDIIRQLKNGLNGKSLTVNWYHDAGDDDVLEIAGNMESVTGIKFKYHEVEE
ncbi:MAG: hypothetical protein POELPBGB_02185 [Bacteroidia bacterium]|nr:hypothetical protein [Bacteroidia bacterium]